MVSAPGYRFTIDGRNYPIQRRVHDNLTVVKTYILYHILIHTINYLVNIIIHY